MGPHIKLKKKTEYLAINSKETDNLILEEGIVIKQVDYAKYLRTIINKTEGTGKEEIRNRIDQSKKIISYLNTIWWDPQIRNDTKKYIGKILVDSVCYGCETWTINEQYKRRINAVEMDYLRRSARVSRLEHTSNEEKDGRGRKCN
jgi:hypothetical protein